MIILGIDPGIAHCGVRRVGGRRAAASGWCGAGPSTPLPGCPCLPACGQIADDMELLLDQFRPEAMAVEELFFNTNVTTGIGVARPGASFWWRAERRGIPFSSTLPARSSRRWWGTERRRSGR